MLGHPITVDATGIVSFLAGTLPGFISVNIVLTIFFASEEVARLMVIGRGGGRVLPCQILTEKEV